MIRIEKEVIETDVLIVGGGIAGLMAAINAADHGYLFLLGTEDIRGTYVGAQPAGVAFLLDNDRWHNEILLYESN